MTIKEKGGNRESVCCMVRWFYPIDWTATGALIAIVISTGQIGISVWSVKRTERFIDGRAAEDRRAKAEDRHRIAAERRTCIALAAATIENAAREIEVAQIPENRFARLSETTERAILASFSQVGTYLRDGQEVGARTAMALAHAEQILARVREIMPHNEHVWPSNQVAKAELLREQAWAIRSLLEELDAGD